MKIAICDDEAASRYALNQFLAKYKSERGLILYIYEFKNGTELIGSDRTFDVIFMDYEMNGLNGIETCQKIREANTDVKIIFLSAFPQVVFKSFTVNTFRFLTKPINETELFAALDDCLRLMSSDGCLLVKTHDANIKLKYSEIVYAETRDKYCVLRTVKGTEETNRTLKEIEALLPEDRFFRCHKSYVVNFLHIKNHTNDEISFDNGEKATISKRCSKEFKEKFRQYILKFNSGAVDI